MSRWPRAAPAVVRRAVQFEVGMWRSLARWLLRRPDVAPGDTAFAYRGPLVAPMVVMLVPSRCPGTARRRSPHCASTPTTPRAWSPRCVPAPETR
jgi:hypothetical protein